MMVAAMHRITPEVGQGVVHPAHIPFEAKAQTAHVGWARDHRPSGALFGNRLHLGEILVDFAIELAQENNRINVLITAILIRNPLALFARIVEVEHARHSVYPQPINVVLIEPTEGRADQEAPHLVAPIVKDVAAPVGMVALARVGVLVEMRPIEVA